MISVSDALALICENRPSFGVERIHINVAAGRIAAEDIHALVNMPPFISSGMDGYAVQACKVGDILKLIGESAAGKPFHRKLGHGEAVRISTGAVVPDGADRILMQEHAHIQLHEIAVEIAPPRGAYVRTAASDFKTGDHIVSKNAKLTPAEIILCAAANHVSLPVKCKPKIALISSGNELRPPGSELLPGEIVAANAVGLKAALESWGAEVCDMGIVKDNMREVETRIESLSDFDIILPIGGASVGDHDLMRPSFISTGYNILFERVAVKPGKPCWMARNENQIVFGLPGNPASALVCAHIFLRPLLSINTEPTTVVLDVPVEENGPRETYLRASTVNVDGTLIATPYPVQDSYRLRPQASANSLLRIPPLGGPYKTGQTIEALQFNEASPW